MKNNNESARFLAQTKKYFLGCLAAFFSAFLSSIASIYIYWLSTNILSASLRDILVRPLLIGLVTFWAWFLYSMVNLSAIKKDIDVIKISIISGISRTIFMWAFVSSNLRLNEYSNMGSYILKAFTIAVVLIVFESLILSSLLLKQNFNTCFQWIYVELTYWFVFGGMILSVYIWSGWLFWMFVYSESIAMKIVVLLGGISGAFFPVLLLSFLASILSKDRWLSIMRTSVRKIYRKEYLD